MADDCFLGFEWRGFKNDCIDELEWSSPGRYWPAVKPNDDLRLLFDLSLRKKLMADIYDDCGSRFDDQVDD